MKILLIFLLAIAFTQALDANVSLVLVKSLDSINYETVKLKWESMNETFNDPLYDNTKKSVLFIFGFMNNLTSTCTTQFVKTFLPRKLENIFILDWSPYSQKLNYIQVVKDIEMVNLEWKINYYIDVFFYKVALYVAEQFKFMREIGFKIDNWHFIGFSLGY